MKVWPTDESGSETLIRTRTVQDAVSLLDAALAVLGGAPGEDATPSIEGSEGGK